jgi:hypothetical protein
MAFATQYASCLIAFAAGKPSAGALGCGPQGGPAQIAGGGGTTPSPAPSRLTSLPQGSSTSVIDLEIGRREDVNRALGRR